MLTVILLLISNTFMTFAWFGRFTSYQLKIIQEAITSLSGVCLFGAVVFAFWGRA